MEISTPGNPPKEDGPVLAQTGTPNPKRIKCPYCSETFRDNFLLDDHIKAVHPQAVKQLPI